MEELPTPLSRVELYLAKAAGMDVTPPEPKSRLELFLAKIAGMDVEMPAPLSLKEMWLAHVAGSAPIEPLAIEGAFYIDNQKVDVRYLAVAAGVIGATLPEKPQNRKEQYWAVIASGGPIVGVLKYVTGTNITLTDVVSGIEELQFVYGDTEQQTYSGKNMLVGNYGTSTAQSVEHSWDNVYVTVSGTPSSSYSNLTSVLSISVSTGDYTFSIDKANSEFRVVLRVTYGGENHDVVITQGDTSESFTIPDTATDAIITRIFISNLTTGTAIYDTFGVMLESGSSASPFEPYTGGIPAPNPDYPQDIQVVTGEQTVTVGDGVDSEAFPISLGSIELCKLGDYQDYVYKGADGWYVHKDLGKVVLDGTESWEYASASAYPYRYTITDAAPLTDSQARPPKVFVNYFTPFYWNITDRPDYGATSSIDKKLAFRDVDITSLADWKTWLSTHNTVMYYVLATPTDTKITDATLVGQLNAIDSAVLPKPVAYITVGATNPNLPAPIKISYYGESE